MQESGDINENRCKTLSNELNKVLGGTARGGLFLFLGMTSSMAILAANSMIIGRLLGPYLYGQYALSLFLPQLLFLFSGFGINQGLIKNITDLYWRREEKRLVKIIQSGVMFRGFIGIIASFAVFCSANYFSSFVGRPEITLYIQLSSPALVFQVLYSVIVAVFIGLEKTNHSALMNVIFAAIKFAASTYLVLIGLKITGAILGNLIGYMVVDVIGASILLIKLKNFSQRNGNGEFRFAENMKILMGFGMPLYASTLLTGFMPLYQDLILALSVTSMELGNFKAAINFVTAIKMILSGTSIILLQISSKISSLNMKNRMTSIFKAISKYTAILIVPAIGAVILFSKEIIGIIYGSNYQLAPIYLSSLCIIYLLVPLGYLTLFNLLSGLGETKMALKITLINFILFLVLGPSLTKIYGVAGIIASFIISNSASTFFAINLAKRKFRVEFKVDEILGAYLIGGLSGIPLILFHSTFISSTLSVAIGILIYFFTYMTLILLTRILNETELKVAISALHDIRLLVFLIRLITAYQRKILNIRLFFISQ